MLDPEALSAERSSTAPAKETNYRVVKNPKPSARVDMSGGTALAEMAKAERVKNSENSENSVTDSAGIG